MWPPRRQLDVHDYRVAWICPGPEVALDPARILLEEEHEHPRGFHANFDDNIYVCGSMSGHNVVLATTPPGSRANVNASRLASPILKSFPNIRITLLVGIGGGVPGIAFANKAVPDLRLGDVVVGCPGDGKPAVVYYDTGISNTESFDMRGTTNRAGWTPEMGVGILASNHRLGKTRFDDHITELQRHDTKKEEQKYQYPGIKHDTLYQANYKHVPNESQDCGQCDDSKAIPRIPRQQDTASTPEMTFHPGRIGTGNAVIADGEKRDEISRRCGGVLCLECSAAGVDASSNCLVIRGISDYCDSHKNGLWKSYAAGMAAVFAKELLRTIHPIQAGLEMIPRAIPSVSNNATNDDTLSGNSIEMRDLLPGIQASGLSSINPTPTTSTTHLVKPPGQGVGTSVGDVSNDSQKLNGTDMFCSLGNNPDRCLRDDKKLEIWERMTCAGMDIYENIYDRCLKDGAGNVERNDLMKFFPPESHHRLNQCWQLAAPPNSGPHPPLNHGLSLAVIYMVHLRHFEKPKGRSENDVQRELAMPSNPRKAEDWRNRLRGFSVWVSCNCDVENCLCLWNFVNYWGLCRNPMSTCKAQRSRQMPTWKYGNYGEREYKVLRERWEEKVRGND